MLYQRIDHNELLIIRDDGVTEKVSPTLATNQITKWYRKILMILISIELIISLIFCGINIYSFFWLPKDVNQKGIAVMLLLIPSIIYFALGLIFTYYFRRSALILFEWLSFIEMSWTCIQIFLSARFLDTPSAQAVGVFLIILLIVQIILLVIIVYLNFKFIRLIKQFKLYVQQQI